MMTINQIRQRCKLAIVTPSQWRSLAAAVIGGLVTLSQSLPGLPAALKGAGITAPHWVPGAVTIACLIITMLSRSPLAKRSGLSTADPEVKSQVLEAVSDTAKAFIDNTAEALKIQPLSTAFSGVTKKTVIPERKTIMSNTLGKVTYILIKDEIESTLAPLVREAVTAGGATTLAKVESYIDSKVPTLIEGALDKLPTAFHKFLEEYEPAAIAYIEGQADAFVESAYKKLLSEVVKPSTLPLVPDSQAAAADPAF